MLPSCLGAAPGKALAPGGARAPQEWRPCSVCGDMLVLSRPGRGGSWVCGVCRLRHRRARRLLRAAGQPVPRRLLLPPTPQPLSVRRAARVCGWRRSDTPVPLCGQAALPVNELDAADAGALAATGPHWDGVDGLADPPAAEQHSAGQPALVPDPNPALEEGASHAASRDAAQTRSNAAQKHLPPRSARDIRAMAATKPCSTAPRQRRAAGGAA